MSIFGAEVIGTAILILLGDGVVAATLLARSKAENGGWIVITFGWAMGVAMGALAKEVRAASLLAFMASLPIAVLALVPSGAVSSGLYDVLRVVSALFPFKPALDALDAAISGGSFGLPLLHLAILAVAFGLLSRLALRRFAAA